MCASPLSTSPPPQPAGKIIFDFQLPIKMLPSLGIHRSHQAVPTPTPAPASYQMNDKAIKEVKQWLFYQESEGTAYTEHHFI